MKIAKNRLSFALVLGLALSPSLLTAIEGEIGREEKPKTKTELEKEQKTLEKQQGELEKERKKEEKNFDERDKEVTQYRSNLRNYEIGSREYIEEQIKMIDAQSGSDTSRQKLGVNEEERKLIEGKLNFIKEQLTAGYEPPIEPDTPGKMVSKFISNVKDFMNTLVEKTKETISTWLGKKEPGKPANPVPSLIQANAEIAKFEAQEFKKENETLSWKKRQTRREAVSPTDKYGQQVEKLKKAESDTISKINDGFQNDLTQRIRQWAERFNKEISQAQTIQELTIAQGDIQPILDDPQKYFKDFQRKVDVNKLYTAVFDQDNPYEVLGLSEDSSIEEIDAAFNEQFTDASAQEKKKIALAYNTLKQAPLRAIADSNSKMIDKLLETLNQSIGQASDQLTKSLSEVLKTTQERIKKLGGQAGGGGTGLPPQ